MRLYLAQHGLSDTDESGEKTLTEKGEVETRLIARVAANYGIVPAAIVHSGKRRAHQTAELFQKALGVDAVPVAIEGIKPLDDVLAFAERLEKLEDHLIVGHLPFLDRLLSYLACGNQDAGIFRFQNSGLICLDARRDETTGWNAQILWMLNPHVQ